MDGFLLKNLPLKCWKRAVFEAIGQGLGGFACHISILWIARAIIQVKNLAGFLPADIAIEDAKLGTFLSVMEILYLLEVQVRKVLLMVDDLRTSF